MHVIRGGRWLNHALAPQSESGTSAGFYALVPASLVAFISGVLSAWNFLLPPPDML